MSWMDSWSRPSKSQPVPPPLYLTIGPSVPYCHTCGRVISERKKTTAAATAVKYCSQRCRHQKPGALDRRIERAFVELLDGGSEEAVKSADAEVDECGDGKEKENEKGGGEEEQGEQEGDNTKFKKKTNKSHKKTPSKSKPTTTKGDPRHLIPCTTIEALIFARQPDPEKVYGRRKNRRPRFIPEAPEDWRSVDMLDDPQSPTAATTPTVEPTNPSSSEEEEEEEEEQKQESHDPHTAANTAHTHPQPDTIPLPLPHLHGSGSGRIRPPQSHSDSLTNGSTGGETPPAQRHPETPDARARRLDGQRRAEEREMVRRAARRGCAFGFTLKEDDGSGEKNGKGGRRKCEAVMKGVVVEASFAKGEWGVRWREDV